MALCSSCGSVTLLVCGCGCANATCADCLPKSVLPARARVLDVVPFEPTWGYLKTHHIYDEVSP